MYDTNSVFLRQFGNDSSTHEVIARDVTSELVYMHGNETDIDPHFVLISMDGRRRKSTKATFGYTGMMQAVETIEGEQLFSRPNAYGVFQTKLKERKLKKIIDRTYVRIRNLDFAPRNERRKAVLDWDYHRLMERFKDFSPLLRGHIVPDYSDTMLVIPLGEGCIDDCIWCPYAKSHSGGLKFYPQENMKAYIDYAKDVVERHHPVVSLHEAFFAASDIFWFKLMDGPDPIEAVKYLERQFWNGGDVHFSKRSAFFGVRSGLLIKEKFPDADKYFKQVFSWFNRGLVGLETLEDRLSIKGGKPILAEDKIQFVNYILNNTLVEKLKLIVQTDLDPDEDVSVTANGVAQIVKKHNSGNPRKVTVEVSLHIPERGFGLEALTDEKLARAQKKYRVFEEAFKTAKADPGSLRSDYEMALPSFQF